MMNNRVNPFNKTQLTAIGEYLSEKEAEGLRLVSFTKSKFTFKEASPNKAKYCAVIFRKVEKEEFLLSAEEKGWELVDSDRDIFIFRSERENPEKIITDGKTTLKATLGTVAGSFAFLGLIAFHFVRVFLLENGSYEAPFEAKSHELSFLVMLSAFAVCCLLKVFNYALWRIKAERKVKKGSEIPFYNLKQTKVLHFLEDFLYIIVALLWTVSAYAFSYGYTDDLLYFYFSAGLAGLFILTILLGRILFTRKNTLVKVFALLLLSACLFTAAYASGQQSLKAYEKNKVNFLGADGNPVSVTDFGVEEEKADEKENFEYLTPFAEYYIFRSNTKKEEPDSTYVYYHILRSDSERVLSKYENDLKDRIFKYGYGIELQSDKWDYLCREARDGKELQYGYGVKGNTIVHLDVISDITFEEFFDKAYEKLFEVQ